MNNRPRVVLLGTPEFALAPFAAIASLCEILLVITAPEDARKGPSPVECWAREQNFQTIAPQSLTPGTFQDTDYDAFIIAAYGKILKPEILNIPKKGAINVHPSLLPLHRGPSPIQGAIAAGDKKTGVTLMLTDEKIDHGPIIAQTETSIGPRETSIELSERLSLLAANLIQSSLLSYIQGETRPLSQEHEQASFTQILHKNDGRIRWGEPMETIDRYIRAYALWPTSWTHYENKRVKILSTNTTTMTCENIPPGSLQIRNNALLVATADMWLEIISLQPEGKSVMDGASFARGYIRDSKDALFT